MKVNTPGVILQGWKSRNKSVNFECAAEGNWSVKKNEAIKLRKKVQEYFFDLGFNKSEITRKLDVSRNFVIKWTQSPDQDVTEDKRGWEKGKHRKWDSEAVDRIVQIRKDLEEDPDTHYWGASAIEIEYRKRHPDKEVPPVRTIGKILSDQDLTEDQKEGKSTGALNYLRYPNKTIYELFWDRVGEADFVGEKFITGQSEPLHFLGYSFKKEPKFRHYVRVQAKTAKEFIKHTKAFISQFERPDALKVDNAASAIGSGYHKRTLSKTMEFLLKNRINPIFSVPRTPASQASIEGSNAVFAKKFWKNYEFESLQQVDKKLEVFNQNTREYQRYQPPEGAGKSQDEFSPSVYFARQVREKQDQEEGYVDIMNEEVTLPKEYISYFVLGEWNLPEEKLLIRFERGGREEEEEEEEVRSEVIKQQDFPIHEASKERCENLLN